MNNRWVVLLLLVAGHACAAPSDFVGNEAPVEQPAPLRAALAQVDAAALAEHIAWLAAPEREGRGLGTKGLEATADRLAAELAAMGIAPLRERSYFQSVPLREVSNARGTVTIGGVDVKTVVLPEIAPQTISGPVIDAGLGIREPALGHDDYRGLDVRGKIVLVRAGVPPGPQWQAPELVDRWASPRAADRYDSRLELLKELGAKAVIAVEPDLVAEAANTYYLASSGAPESGEPPLARVGAPVPPRLLRGEIRVTATVRSASSRNVIGVIEGTDPQLKSEAVVIGAHMDHLGMAGGVLHPGADDNASGAAALLEIARVFAASPSRPKRSLVIVFWTAEEAGQLGSSWYVRHPAWPLARTAAYINLDMIAHPWTPEEIEHLVKAEGGDRSAALLAQATPANFAEPGVAKGSPELLVALAAAARGTGMVLHFDRTDGVDGGSDYRAFARRGLPFVRFFGNFFPGYHEPSDTPDRIDPAQVARITRLALATAWLIAQ